jgi:tetratricopeptide (TPR) repeat protein
MRWLVVCWLALVSASANAADDVHARAEALAREKRFDEAEAVYRSALRSAPRDDRIRLGLARVILWSGRYVEAEREFAALLRERPRDAGALLGHAQAAYWMGDFRAALPRFERVIAADPGNAEARRALEDLRSLTASRYTIAAETSDDSQPLRREGTAGRISLFSDPLTRWDFEWRAATLRSDEDDGTLVSAGFGIESAFPRHHLTAAAHAALFRFPDEHDDLIGDVTIGYRRFSAALERKPLLGTASSLDAHPAATVYRLSWNTKADARWQAALGAHLVDYSDENRGRGADGYLLLPFAATLHAGLSAAWRDTDQNRFRFTGFRSERLNDRRFRYTFSGIYDPYWTPHRLRVVRAVVVAERTIARARVKLQADAGYARDRYLVFSPPEGPTPSPAFTFPLMLERSFRPWRASIEATIPLTPAIELRAGYHHDVTVFYRSNAIQASVGGRF